MRTIADQLKYTKSLLDGKELKQARLIIKQHKGWGCTTIDNGEHLDVEIVYDDNLSLFLSYEIKDNKLNYEGCLLTVGDETWQLD